MFEEKNRRVTVDEAFYRTPRPRRTETEQVQRTVTRQGLEKSSLPRITVFSEPEPFVAERFPYETEEPRSSHIDNSRVCMFETVENEDEPVLTAERRTSYAEEFPGSVSSRHRRFLHFRH